jgi:hypothetical protein
MYKKSINLLLSLLFLTQLSFAQNKLKTEKINVFKNGTYFVLKSGQVDINDKKALLETPTSPLLGTFWLMPQNSIRINQIVFVTDTLKKSKHVNTIYDVILSNSGKQVTLTYQINEEIREISGLLSARKGSQIVSIKTRETKTVYIPTNKILNIMVEGSPVETYESDSLSRVCKVLFDKDMRSTNLNMMYMQTGIQWIPMYHINILNENEIHLELKAVVENYAESIKGADLTLTVGEPQFFWGRQLDPISSNYLTNIFNQTPIATGAYQWSNAIYSVDETISGSAFYDSPALDTYNTSGAKSNDLYMFHIGNADLPKNSKTTFEIFGQNLPYEDVYEVALTDVTNYSYNRYLSIDKEKNHDVFHSLKLTNTTKQPLTTAPVFVLDEKQNPLAQDRIKYTAVGSKVSVQLSKSGDVIVKNNEEELEVVQSFKRFNKVNYNKVIIKGSIEVENMQDKKIRLDVTKSLTAMVNSADNNGKIIKSGKYYNYNPYSTIEWTIDLKPGEKKTLNYEYYVLINQ